MGALHFASFAKILPGVLNVSYPVEDTSKFFQQCGDKMRCGGCEGNHQGVETLFNTFGVVLGISACPFQVPHQV